MLWLSSKLYTKLVRQPVHNVMQLAAPPLRSCSAAGPSLALGMPRAAPGCLDNPAKPRARFSSLHRLQRFISQVMPWPPERQQEDPDVSEPSNIIFCGNPGSGKSTLLNSLMGEVKFEAGISAVGGLTCKSEIGLPTATSKGRSFIDTPGLSDATMREQAAAEIRKAFKTGGKYALFFVLTLEAGRVKPEDLTTIHLVLDAVPDILEYGLIFNKVSKPVLDLIKREGQKSFLHKLFMNFKCSTTDKVFFNSKDEKLEDEANVLVDASDELWQFVESVKSQKVNATLKIASNDFESMEEQNKKDLANLKKENQEAIRMMQEMRQKYEELRVDRILTANFLMAGGRAQLSRGDRVKKVSKLFWSGLCVQSGSMPRGAEGVVVGPDEEVEGKPTVLVQFESQEMSECEEKLWYHQIQKVIGVVQTSPPIGNDSVNASQPQSGIWEASRI